MQGLYEEVVWSEAERTPKSCFHTGDIEKSALAEHVLNPGHAIDWSNATTDLLPVSRPMPAFGVVVCTKPTSDLNRELYWTLMGRH